MATVARIESANAPVIISFVIPAHNEAAGLPRTLQAIHDSARTVGQPYEIIVVDDASTDATPDIARQYGAIVVSVQHRQIAATRNSGARAARSDRLFFVDADTLINPRALASAIYHLDHGAPGGGAVVWFNEPLPLYARLLGFLATPFVMNLVGFTGGAFMFCTREVFQAGGGFDERLFCGEDASMVMAIKRAGRFVVVPERVLTSGRKCRTMSGLQLAFLVARLALSPVKSVTRRAPVEKLWYDSNRTQDDRMPDTLGFKLANAITLLLTLIVLSWPLWNLVPRSLTPLTTTLGKIRFTCGILLSHLGLILWPASALLFASLLRRQQWIEWTKLALLFAFCLWQAIDSTQGVIRIWTLFGTWAGNLGG